MSKKPLVFIGYGQHAAVVHELVELLQREIVGYTDRQKQNCSLNYLGTDAVLDTLERKEVELVIGFGSIRMTRQRQLVFKQYKQAGFQFATLVHPTAIVSDSVQLGEGSQVFAGAIIQAQVQIQENVLINTGVIVEHHSTVLAHTHLAPQVLCCGQVTIGENCHIGAGATIIQGINIANDTTVGAGAVVIHPIKSKGRTVIGVPAKEVDR